MSGVNSFLSPPDSTDRLGLGTGSVLGVILAGAEIQDLSSPSFVRDCKLFLRDRTCKRCCEYFWVCSLTGEVGKNVSFGEWMPNESTKQDRLLISELVEGCLPMFTYNYIKDFRAEQYKPIFTLLFLWNINLLL